MLKKFKTILSTPARNAIEAQLKFNIKTCETV